MDLFSATSYVHVIRGIQYYLLFAAGLLLLGSLAFCHHTLTPLLWYASLCSLVAFCLGNDVLRCCVTIHSFIHVSCCSFLDHRASVKRFVSLQILNFIDSW
jgi:hypothetical protein